MSGNEKFIRWQGYRINQVGFAMNLFLGLATAVLGFSISLLKDEKFILCGIAKYLFTATILFQLFSLFSGIVAVMIRIYDFRFTARIARIKEKNQYPNRVPTLTKQVKLLGKCMWFWFWVQIILFVFGMLTLIISIFIKYNDRLL